MKKESKYQFFRTTQTIERLLKRFGSKDFSEKYKWLRYTATATSYLVNAMSAAGAFYGLYYLLSFAIPYPAITTVLCALLLCVHEYTKRKSSDHFWDEFWSKNRIHVVWLSCSLFLFVASFGVSAFGLWQGTKDFAPTANIIENDAELAQLQAQNEQINKSIQNAENTRWQGTTTSKSQKAIIQFSQTQNQILADIAARTAFINTQNQSIKTEHTMTLRKVIVLSLLIYLFLEIIFELSMCFCSHYDFRFLTEKADHARLENMFSIETHTAPIAAIAPTQQDRRIGFVFGQKKQAETSSETNPETETETSAKQVVSKNTAVSETPLKQKTETETRPETGSETKARIKELERKIKSYQWKLRNRKGKPETAKKNIENFKREIEKLRQKKKQ